MKTPTRPLIGHQLAAARRAAGLTQAHVAQAAGTTQERISRVESGNTAITPDTLGRIAKAIGVEWVWDKAGPRVVE
jgi:transcriptional regulator with XRE-family HTH domain